MAYEDHIETITTAQDANGMWLVRVDGQRIGDCKPCDSAEECMAWARKFFGPNFNYQDAA